MFVQVNEWAPMKRVEDEWWCFTRGLKETIYEYKYKYN